MVKESSIANVILCKRKVMPNLLNFLTSQLFNSLNFLTSQLSNPTKFPTLKNDHRKITHRTILNR
jgi:hypothetical protein